MYVIKQYDSYFKDTFEVNGTIIMTNFTNDINDAKKFDDFDEAIKELNRLKHQDANVVEI